MPHRAGAKHGLIAFLSGLLAIKLLIKKGVFFIDELVQHQIVHLPLEIVLVELPISVFGTTGRIVKNVLDTGLPAEAIGLVVVYPVIVGMITGLTHGGRVRAIGSYWLGTTVLTAVIVAMSVGLAPDPADVGSGLAYHLQNHTLALVVQDAVLGVGRWVSTAGEFALGRPVDETVGVLVSGVAAAFVYGGIWEVYIGH